MDRLGVDSGLPGHSSWSLLAHHFLDHHTAHMVIPALFYESDVYYELHHAVGLVVVATAVS